MTPTLATPGCPSCSPTPGDPQRRFWLMSTAAAGGVAAVTTAIPFVSTLAPSERARAGGGPVFLELQTFRFRAHSMYDPDRYREASEIERWKERDPLLVLGERLQADDPDADARLAAIEAEVAAEVDDAVAYADAADVESLD